MDEITPKMRALPLRTAVKKFNWTPVSLEFALRMAANGAKRSRVAAELGISADTATRWMQHTDMQTRILEHRQQIIKQVFVDGIANKQERLNALNERWEALKEIRDQIAVSQDMVDVPGGDTGFMRVKTTTQRVGNATTTATEYVLNDTLMREFRELEKQAALEEQGWAAENSKSGELLVRVEYDAPPPPPHDSLETKVEVIDGESRRLPEGDPTIIEGVVYTEEPDTRPPVDV